MFPRLPWLSHRSALQVVLHSGQMSSSVWTSVRAQGQSLTSSAFKPGLTHCLSPWGRAPCGAGAAWCLPNCERAAHATSLGTSALAVDSDCPLQLSIFLRLFLWTSMPLINPEVSCLTACLMVLVSSYHQKLTFLIFVLEAIWVYWMLGRQRWADLF